MPYLIDGHNLIAHMPGMTLADPDDEAQLVLKLRQFAARKKRKITVVFDHGIPGGWSRDLSTGPVKVVFAGSHSNADRVILERLREAARPRDIQLVTSDQALRREGEARHVEVIPSQEFARRVLEPSGAPSLPRDERDNIRLTRDEVKEWMRVFKKGTANRSD